MKDFIDHLIKQAPTKPFKYNHPTNSNINNKNQSRQPSTSNQKQQIIPFKDPYSKYLRTNQKNQQDANQNLSNLNAKSNKNNNISQSQKQQKSTSQINHQYINQSKSIYNKPKYGRQQQIQPEKNQETVQQSNLNNGTTHHKNHFSRKPAQSNIRYQLPNQAQTRIVQEKIIHTKVQPIKQQIKAYNKYKNTTFTQNQKKQQVQDNINQSKLNTYQKQQFKSPLKSSPLSSSRDQQSIRQQVAKSQIKQQSKIKIRSNIIYYTINKFYMKKVKNGLTLIKENNNKVLTKNNNFAKLFFSSTDKISKAYIKNIQKQFIKRLKMNGNKKYTQQIKSFSKTTQIMNQNVKNSICNMIQIRFRKSLRSGFNEIKNMTPKRQLTLKGVMILSLLQIRKFRSNFQLLKINSKRKAYIQQILLNKMTPIIIGYQMRNKKAAFNKLIKNNLPQLKKIQKIKVKSKTSGISESGVSISSQPSQSEFIPLSHAAKQSPFKSNIQVFQPNQSTVQNMRQKIQDSKSEFLTQKRSLQQFLSDLRILVKQNQSHVQNLNEANKRLKQQAQKTRSSHDQQEGDSFNDRQQGYLPKLSEIYCDIFKRSDNNAERICLKNLIQKYQLDMSLLQSDPCLMGWNVLKINSDLKRQVQVIEGLQRQRKTALILQEEHKVIQNLVKSYIKQRYLWQWMRSSIKNSG